MGCHTAPEIGGAGDRRRELHVTEPVLQEEVGARREPLTPFAPAGAAMTPARNSPSSLDAPTNTILTALSRPRTRSGVQSWISVSRM